jgi:hypothetical protein
MGATAHHGFTKPHPDTGPFDPGGDIVALADSADTKLVKFFTGTGSPPSSGMRAGDVFMKVPAATVFGDPESLLYGDAEVHEVPEGETVDPPEPFVEATQGETVHGEYIEGVPVEDET